MHALEAYRQRHGLTLEKLGEAAGTTATSLSRIISGKQVPSAGLLQRIHTATQGEVSPNDMLVPDAPQPAEAS